MDRYLTAKHKLADLAVELSAAPLNEATTRLRLIDRLLMDCLDWRPGDITSEDRYDGRIADYVLGVPSPQMVVEAKKEGIHFVIPSGLTGRRSVELRTLLEDATTAAAIRQVLGYCNERGVPIAVLANGHQLVAFYASRQDGVRPLEGRAVMFSSLDEMVENFPVLWECLSREGIALRNLQRMLLGRAPRAIAPGKLSDQIRSYSELRPKSSLETDLKFLGELFLQDLGTSGEVKEDFIRECYCETGALSQYAAVSKEILRSRYAALEAALPVAPEAVTTRDGINPSLTSSTLMSAMSNRPLILVGDVGVGKSMFIRHLLQVEAREVLSNAYVFYVDFGKEPTLATQLRPYVVMRLAQQMREKHGVDIEEAAFSRVIYKAELDRFERGIWGEYKLSDPAFYRQKEVEMLAIRIADTPEHLRSSLKYLAKKKKRSPVFVLDNIDQRSSEFQDEVFLIAQSLADGWPGTVFVTLRPETMYASKNKGSLAAYPLKIFTVSPPRADQVISRRLEWAHEKLLDAASGGAFQVQFSINAPSMRAVLESIMRAFAENHQLKEILDNLSGGNTRTALEFLNTFIGSGFVSIERVLDVAQRGEVYSVPVHEFLRAIIFGDYNYYVPSASKVCNVLEIYSDDGREHFLMPLILSYVEQSALARDPKSFVEIAGIYKIAQECGYMQEQVGPHVDVALARGLLQAPHPAGAEGPFRITAVGSYMYKSMLTRFVYLDAMIVDTPITDVRYRMRISDVHSILDRVERGRTFREYLDSQWAKLSSVSQGLPFDWATTSERLASDMDDAERRARRAERARRA
ncbi:hypothetical protein [Micromonospora ureilytica]|uniref:hypothetical protein n=1 Tax=Micromonospora ureilytica TaxID=709868 RepID=UPI000F5EEC15|nr:hypothetical protein [Micromonospora ureilytica]